MNSHPVQFNFEMKKKYGNPFDSKKIYQSPQQNCFNNDRDFMYDYTDDGSATSKLYSNIGRQPGLGKGRRFNPPIKSDGQPGSYNPGRSVVNHMNGGMQQKGAGEHQVNYLKVDEFGNPHEGYAALDPRLVEIIEGEILEKGSPVTWNDIAGLDFAKKTINEIIILPMLRPDLFKGIRAPPKGVLLFGPPGTGKTMIGKAIASQCKFTFFNISASSLTSKWVGEGEKLVKTLFKLAVIHQPAVIFIDEIDSLLCNRTENENEAGRKIKTEFMVHMGGAGTNEEDRMLIIGATNRPFELDEAVRRRLEKRLYIPLPAKEGRMQFMKTILEKERHSKFEISDDEIYQIVELTKGYSGADLRSLCCEAAFVPIREQTDILNVSSDSIRAVVLPDFIEAINKVKPTVNQSFLYKYIEWNKDFGSYQLTENDIDT